MNASVSVLESLTRVRERGLRNEDGRAAAEAVVRELGPDVMRLCLYRTGGRRQDAEDLFQETFAGLFEQVVKGRIPTSVGAYIATIARRRADSRYQRRETLLDGVFEAVSQVSPEGEVIERIDLLTLVGLLPTAMRRVVLGTLVDGTSTQKLADELGTSEENVRQLRSRAVSIIKELREDTRK